MNQAKSALDEGFAGIPSGSTPVSNVMTSHLQGAASAPYLPPHQAKRYRKFTLPKSVLGANWGSSNFTDKDLEFGMTEITTDQRLRASRAAGGAKMDFQAVNLENVYQTIYMIGGKLTNNNRSVIKGWFDAIGPKAQDLVERIFSEMTSVTESEFTAVMSGGSWEEG